MRYSPYTTTVAVVTVCVIVLYVVFNYSVDSLRVFHQHVAPFQSHSDINERVMKSLYLKEHCTGINTIVFGDSRTAGYTTDALGALFNDSVSYNYGVQSDTLVGVLQKMQWLESMQCFPERIILPVSLDLIELTDYADDARLLMQENPTVLGDSLTTRNFWVRRWLFVKKYLFSSAIFIKNIKKINHLVVGTKYHLKFTPTTGDIYYSFDHPCTKDILPVGSVRLKKRKVDAFIKQLQRIQNYTENLNKDLFILWNPQLYKIQMSYDMGSLEGFLKKIENIFPTIFRVPLDDTRLKDISQYHDCSHFKKELGKSLLDTKHLVPVDILIKEFRAEHAKFLN
ncbi:hypothetical protein VT99_10058 [Candidatus Electrothrix marina]|uniref:Uncharacterized protein n=1 Tax=Candidatus Electrothrix marina TaxID=1859130 RepID=A0A444J8G1_9BACT|nr:hypothetical protein VT99_10058 [Candidatus Electrothrix marina]